MNRNSNEHFANVPTVSKPRATFPISCNVRTTFNMGDLVPFYVDADILPGDTWKVNFTCVIRQSTPIYPTMDNSYADVYFFYIPMRICWQHTKEFFGENTNGAWVQQTEYVIPKFTTPTGGAKKGTVMDYMGIPTNVAGLDFQQIPFRAYVKTYNEFFRDQNYIAPATEYYDDTDRTADNEVTELGGKPFKVARFHDFFSSSLPQPQRGEAITLPIGESAPVAIFGTGMTLGLTDGTTNFGLTKSPVDDSYLGYTGVYGVDVGTARSGSSVKTTVGYGVVSNPNLSGIEGVADLSQAVAATINAQRYAFALQHILEISARSGARFREVMRSIYGTTMPDMRSQIPEYLGGKRIPITMNQVAQTSSTDATSPQGNVAAYSLTVDSDHMFTKSFVEPGVLLGLICVRQDHSYSQGLNKMWTRRRRFDIYHPQFAFLGESPVYNREIYAQGTDEDSEVFGYQERWAEYRYKPSLNTGAFRPQYEQSLSAWHYGDYYESLPVMSQEWLEETPVYLDRTLAVTSAVEDQYLMDSHLEMSASRVMPLFSVPSMLDHF